MSDSQPERLGRYELLSRIATGGMATIYLARERGIAGLQRFVVIKRILPHLMDDPQFVEMILREARITAQLSHPNVVQIYALGEDLGQYYIALEYIHGCTLRELQTIAGKMGRPFPLDVSLEIMNQACRGLHAAHELTDETGQALGLVHRDVSPHNLMLTEAGHVKLLDFGVAKTQRGQEVTTSGDLKGKYAYMSPEQAQHLDLDRRSDIFSLGIILWELLTGRRLFKKSSEIAMLQAVSAADVPRPELLNPQVPPAISACVMRALARSPKARHRDAEALRQALIDAARQDHVNMSTDGLAAFVKDVGGARIAARELILDKAQNDDLSHSDGRQLDHRRESTQSQVEIARGEATAAETPAALLKEIPFERRSLAAPKSKRFLFIGLASLLVLVGVSALLMVHMADKEDEPTVEAKSEPELQGPPLRIGWAPVIDPAYLEDQLGSLKTHLEASTGRPVEWVITKDYAALKEALLSGQVPYGVFPPLLYLRTRAKALSVKGVASKVYQGTTTSDGYLIVRQDSGIDSLDDLKSPRFCFTDENSTTGYFLPMAFLREHDLEPSTFIAEIHWSGDHLQVMRDLLDGKCEVAATYNGAYLKAPNFGISAAKLRILSITGHIPQDILVAGPTALAEDTVVLRDALLAFEPTADDKRVEITGFAPVDESAFDKLQETINAATR